MVYVCVYALMLELNEYKGGKSFLQPSEGPWLSLKLKLTKPD